MPLQLPTSAPTGHQYEDLISAVIRGMGYFTEIRMEMRGDERNILLELDIVATPSGDRFLDRLLIEAKTGTFKYADLFKVFGQRVFLGLNRACLVHSKEADPTAAADVRAIVERTAVAPCHVPHDGDSINTDRIGPCCVDFPDEIRGKLVGALWFQSIAQRLGRHPLTRFRNANHGLVEAASAKQYEQAIQQSFFSPEPLDRVRSLYAAWRVAPNLAGDFVQWMAGRDGKDQNDVWTAARRSSAYLETQRVMLLQHQARICIVKCALDHLATTETNERASESLVALDVPQSFLAGVAALRRLEHRNRVPYFLQMFLEGFGGWYDASREEDLVVLAQVTGVPVSKIPETLAILDVFFPMRDSWMFESGSLQVIKVLPAVVAGAGAFLRSRMLGIGDVEGHYGSSGWLVKKWYSAFYDVLRPELEAN